MMLFIPVVLFLLAVLYFVWNRYADADLTLLWMEHFGQKPEILRGEVAWITGASSGIGKHLAYQLARVGCKLVLSARSTDELQKVRKECIGYGNLQEDDVMVLPLDMLDVESHTSATNTVINKFGQIDILVNNAGRSQRAWVVDTALAVDRQMIDLNVVGSISLTKCVLPHMIERRHGRIVVTSSVTGKMPLPFSATYNLTKYAVIGYFHSLSTEVLQHNIDVTVVCPGPVRSNVLAVAYTEQLGQVHGGKHVESSGSLMETSRCADLMIVAMVNKLPEVWISLCPFLYYCYFAQYLPGLYMSNIRKTGGEKTISMRTGQ